MDDLRGDRLHKVKLSKTHVLEEVHGNPQKIIIWHLGAFHLLFGSHELCFLTLLPIDSNELEEQVYTD